MWINLDAWLLQFALAFHHFQSLKILMADTQNLLRIHQSLMDFISVVIHECIVAVEEGLPDMITKCHAVLICV